MSWVRPVLNLWLRLTEKPHLARVSDPDALRRSFETKARLFFHPPRGVVRMATFCGGRQALELTPHGAVADRMILYFHGGAYVFGSPNTHAAMLARLARDAGTRVVAQNYRKAPEHPFPAAIEDAEAAWRDLLDQGKDPRRIVIGGDSAGGGLSLALLAQLLEKGLPLPAGVFAFSPLTDLTFSGPSIVNNSAADVVLPSSRVHETAQIYLQGVAPEDPRASPLFADFSGAPPVWMAVGDTEILLDDTVRIANQMGQAGVKTSVTIAHDVPHVWPLFHNILPEARATLQDLGGWIRQQTGRTGGS